MFDEIIEKQIEEKIAKRTAQVEEDNQSIKEKIAELEEKVKEMAENIKTITEETKSLEQKLQEFKNTQEFLRDTIVSFTSQIEPLIKNNVVKTSVCFNYLCEQEEDLKNIYDEMVIGMYDKKAIGVNMEEITNE